MPLAERGETWVSTATLQGPVFVHQALSDRVYVTEMLRVEIP